jgi:hypothetical protein
MATPATRPTYTRRTFLVDRHFQLKYTAILMVVGASLTVLFGAMMYQAHVDATQMMGLPDKFGAMVVSRYDQRQLWIVAVVAVVMSFALALFGILVTHRVAGPLYIMGRYIRTLGEGSFPQMRPLRHNDELKDFFRGFQESVDQMRSREAADVAALDAALAQLEGYCARTPDAGGALGATLVSLKSLRDRKQAALAAGSTAAPAPAPTAPAVAGA